MRKLLLLLSLVLLSLVAFFLTRDMLFPPSASFDQVAASLEEAIQELPQAGSCTGSGSASKQTLLDVLNPRKRKLPNRNMTFEIESHRNRKRVTDERVIVFVEGRWNQVWKITIDPTADPLLAAEIESHILKRDPSLRPLVSIVPPKP